MPTRGELDRCYMQVAISHASLSKAKRKQVGAALVTVNGALLAGCNGMSSGGSNICEIETDEGLVTKPEVIHAELSCILKAAKEGVSVMNSTIYVTLSPCVSCAEMIKQAGIKEVVYLEEYRSTAGIDKLRELGVRTRKYRKEVDV